MKNQAAQSTGRADAALLAAPMPGITLSESALAQMMPMFLWLSEAGTIRALGPTLAKIAGQDLAGQDFFEVFTIRRPRGLDNVAALRARCGGRLHLRLTGGAPTSLRGLAMPLANGGLLLNLSLGIGVAEGVNRHALTDGDFAPTDLAVEMLYLIEAKGLVMDELFALNHRLHRAKSTAEVEALTDTLTGLGNRRGFERAMSALLRSRTDFGVMQIDLDYFKQVNDSYGHAAGDEALCRIADILCAETRTGDAAARVGGDEFVLLLGGVTNPERLQAVAARIMDRLGQPQALAGHRCRLSVSIGMAASVLYGTPTAQRLMSDADAALYVSKGKGRGCATLWTPEDRSA